MNPIWLEDTIKRFLNEDIGRGDITTEAIVLSPHKSTARLIAKEVGVIAGLQVAAITFRLLDPEVKVILKVAEGEKVQKGDTLAEIKGDAAALLTAERSALNLLQRMSGIATATSRMVELIRDLHVHVTDTRKTMPGLGPFDKYAVRIGGGANHRMGLDDAVLIKDNHIAVSGGIREALRRVQLHTGHLVKVEVEVENLAQLEEALSEGADAIMLDNMSVCEMKEAVQRIRTFSRVSEHEQKRNGIVVEASGNITTENIREVALTGVDLISLGYLTHSVRALDVSCQFVVD